MLKQFGVMVVVALATAACGGAGAQPASPAASDTALPKLSVPLPDKYKTAGKLNVGVKCDYPPFGYTDEQGKIVGYELDLTRRLAAFAFGSTDAVNLQCVTSANRISFLTTNRIDLIVATITYTPERAKTITFSDPYFSAAGRLLVPKDSTVKEATDLAGKTAITAKGSVYVTYFQKCVPNATLLQFEATSDSLAALTQSRGQAFMQDDTLLVGLAKQNPNLKVVGSGVASAPWGIGIRQEDKDLANWVNAALAQNQKDDWNWKAFQKWITDKDTQNRFSASVPRPGKSLKYGEGPTVTC
jgi:polar amino acid transport system substrate-binding protein